MRTNMTAFTLAEVLITLAIIGIVASMTIPTLISKYQEKQTVVALKKIYSTLSQSFIYAQSEYGTPSSWENEKSNETTDDFLDKLSIKLKVLQRCKSGQADCYEYPYASLAGAERAKDILNEHSRLITSDGVYIGFYLNSYLCNYNAGSYQNNYINLNNICGSCIVDINGNKLPNVLGRDMFAFWVTSSGIVPAGGQNDDSAEYVFSNNCSKNITYNQGRQAGSGCTAWVIYNGNMDYLHCDDLSWDGKHSCKD